MARHSTVRAAFGGFEAQASNLKARFLTATPTILPYSNTCPPVHDDSKTMLIVFLQNEWGDYCKELLELSVLGQGPTLSGVVLKAIAFPPAIASLDRFLKTTETEVAKNMPNKTEYPVWHNPEYVSRVADKLRPMNYSEINVGLGGSTRARDLNTVRNYIVHGNNRGEYDRLLSRSGARGLSVPQFLSVRTGSRSTFEDWADDLITAAKNAAS